MSENTQIRSAEDLKALLIEGDKYRETVLINYIGQQFEVPIRPLNDLELTQVMRAMKSSKFMKKILAEKKKLGNRTEFTEDEKKQLADKMMDDDGLTETAFASMQLMQEICKLGIADDALAGMVQKFKWGITNQIGSAIQKISNVPPEAIQSFFAANTANSS
jgi:hypothetical protein